MQEEILKLYEKIQDKLSQEEFLAEMNKISENNFGGVDFVDDVDLAREVLKIYGVTDFETSSQEIDSSEESEDVPFEVSLENDEQSNEAAFVMTDDLRERYDKVKDQITEEEFFARMTQFKEQESSNPFMNDTGLADLVVGELVTEEVEVVSEKPEFSVKTLNDLEAGSREVTIEGRVISISNKRSFKTRKGGKGQVCNVEIQDNTATMRTVFWTQNMPLLKSFTEGDIIQIKNVDIKNGYSGLEANLKQRSSVIKLEENPSKFPAYEEEITSISDIKAESKVNIIARIVKISTIRSYEKNGKEGKVASMELQDATGRITYNLWNRNVELIEDLELEDGDTVKILAAQSRERTNMDGISEISLTHWSDSRIVKGDFDVPEIEQEFTPIADLSEQTNVSIKGVVVRLQDIKTFIRKTDNTEGKLRNFDVGDSSGTIRVTVWGDDADLPLNKGDIVKIIDGNVRFDEYTQSGYSMNTTFNTQITINPKNLSEEESSQFEQIKDQLRPTPIGSIKLMEEEGEEVDIIGRFLSVNDVNEFQRDDGSVGVVRSAIFADESGKIQLSLWNERAQENYNVGDAYQIENARTRLGMYDVDLNIGGNSRLIKLSDEQAASMFIPELATLEKAIYDYKKIVDVDEDEEDVILIGRVIELNEVREFDRDNGDTGTVRNIEIADDTSSIRVVLWDKDAKRDLEIGTALKLQNPRLSLDMDNRIEATVSRSTTILEPSESELEKLPSYEELLEAIYVPKSIESLLEDDTNVCVTGTIKEVSDNKNILKKCPNCGANVENTLDENVCDNCGFSFDEPRYTLMIPTRIEDGTGEISATFFGELAEELLEKETSEVVRYIEEGLGIEDKLQDLNGLTVEIIANVSFDDYNEESRLNPKKIISKYF